MLKDFAFQSVPQTRLPRFENNRTAMHAGWYQTDANHGFRQTSRSPLETGIQVYMYEVILEQFSNNNRHLGRGRYGRVLGYFSGWWNFFGWIFNSASMSSILANQVISMYGLFHPGYEYERWHVFMAFLIINWACCFLVMFANRALPIVTNIGLFLILVGVFITIMVCAIMPSQKLGGKGHASSSFVWKEWQNQTGWESNGLVFCMGMLNGAYAVGTP